MLKDAGIEILLFQSLFKDDRKPFNLYPVILEKYFPCWKQTNKQAWTQATQCIVFKKNFFISSSRRSSEEYNAEIVLEQKSLKNQFVLNRINWTKLGKKKD